MGIEFQKKQDPAELIIELKQKVNEQEEIIKQMIDLVIDLKKDHLAEKLKENEKYNTLSEKIKERDKILVEQATIVKALAAAMKDVTKTNAKGAMSSNDIEYIVHLLQNKEVSKKQKADQKPKKTWLWGK